jgi:hypothetical protein
MEQGGERAGFMSILARPPLVDTVWHSGVGGRNAFAKVLSRLLRQFETARRTYWLAVGLF